MSAPELRTSDLQCIHRAGCTKPKVCGEVGHCTSMTETDLKLHADMSREEVDAVMTRTAAAPSSNPLASPGELLACLSSVTNAKLSERGRQSVLVYLGRYVELMSRLGLASDAPLPDETTDVLKTIYRLAGGHAIECQCRQCEIFELLEPIVGNSSRSAVDPPVAHKHWCAKLAPSVYTAMDCNCGAVEPTPERLPQSTWTCEHCARVNDTDTTFNRCPFCDEFRKGYAEKRLHDQGSQSGETEPHLNIPGLAAPTTGTSAVNAGTRSPEKANDCTCGRQKTGDHEPGCTYRPDWL